jgi:hypothetical protein
MPKPIDLDTTLIIVNRSALAKANGYLISSEDFEDPDRSLPIRNARVADMLRVFAMQEMRVTKLAVGDTKALVEFFSLDIKQDKKAVAKLQKVSSLAWLHAIHAAELAREESEEGFFSAALTSSIEDVVRAAELRRFLVNATNNRMMTKTGRTVLLFHHSDANAPQG